MKPLSRCLTLVCIMVLTKSSASPGNASIYNGFHHMETLSNRETLNLRILLNFIQKSPEFRPLRLSIILPEFPSTSADIMLRYVWQNAIETYTIRTRDLALKATWIDRTPFTWALFVQDLNSLSIFVNWQPRLWKSNNQYLIVFTEVETTVAWGHVFRELWTTYGVYRVVILSVEDDFRCLLRYMPFHVRGNDSGGVDRLCPKEDDNRDQRPEVTNVDKVLVLNKDSRLFENFQNLNGHALNVIAFESLLMEVGYDDKKRLRMTKVDANVVYALEKAMGFTFRVRVLRNADLVREDPFDLSLRAIETGNVEMVVTGFFVKSYTQRRGFQFTSAVYEDKLCFLSPDSGLVPKAYMPFMPFEKDLWALLIVYNLGITWLWCFINYLNLSLRHRAHPRSTIPSREEGRVSGLSNQVQMKDKSTGQLRRLSRRPNEPFWTVSHPLTEPPKVHSYLLRILRFVELSCYPLQIGSTPAQRGLLLGTLFFGLIVNGVYQSSLVSSLSKPFHYPQLHTIKDVLDSGKILFTKYANLKSVFLDDMPLDRRLSQQIQVVNDSRPTKRLVAYGDMIAVSRYYTMVLGDYEYYDKEGNPLLHVVDECPMNYRVSYVLRSRSPYTERVNFVLLRLTEAGLLVFWFENMTYPVKIVKSKKLRRKDRKIKLTMGHYSLTFLLLLVGLLSSSFVFFGEVYVTRRAKRKERGNGSERGRSLPSTL